MNLPPLNEGCASQLTARYRPINNDRNCNSMLRIVENDLSCVDNRSITDRGIRFLSFSRVIFASRKRRVWIKLLWKMNVVNCMDGFGGSREFEAITVSDRTYIGNIESVGKVQLSRHNAVFFLEKYIHVLYFCKKISIESRSKKIIVL